MPFIPHDKNNTYDTKIMMDYLNINDIKDLFSEIPRELLVENLGDNKLLASGLSEAEISRLMQDRASNINSNKSYLGAGAYPHFIPAAVWDLASRGEFLTAYTPYQAEASQGSLEVIYEYQTLMTKLMLQEVCNASVYDGASSLAEAVLMAVRIKRNKANYVLVPESLHPLYRQVLDTLLPDYLNIISVAFNRGSGVTDLNLLQQADFFAQNNIQASDICALVIPQPNFFGQLEPVDELTMWAKGHNILSIAVVNPMACAVLKPPGRWGDSTGVDITCGEGQPLGIPLSFGGPYFGFMLTRLKYVRELPGRLVGKAYDKANNSGYTLTLQSREQHIRRAKAKSNICTNQGLCVTAATIYMSLLGSRGIVDVCNKSYQQAHKLYNMLLKIPGVYGLFNNNDFLYEFAVKISSIKHDQHILAKLESLGFQAGVCLGQYYPEYEDVLLICVTETKQDQDLQGFVDAITELLVLESRDLGDLVSS